MFNSIEDRALSEHQGSGLYSKKANGKYSLFLPITGTGENGSAPAQLDKTAIGNRQSTSVEGRQENPQKTIPFFAHRDNINILEDAKGKVIEFMRILPDMTGFKYSGKVSYKLNNTDVGSLEQGEMTITPETSDEYVENCYDLLEDTVVYTSAIDDTVVISGTDTTKTIALATNPSGATINATSDSTGVATVAYTASTNSITITKAGAGSAIIKLVASKSGYNSFTRTILVVVE